MQRQTANRNEGNEASALMKLARRIRSEQGAEQLKAFLQAMTPFFAPNELKNAAAEFGVTIDEAPREPRPVQIQTQAQPRQDPMELIRNIMQIRTLMSGGDPQALFKLIGGK